MAGEGTKQRLRMEDSGDKSERKPFGFDNWTRIEWQQKQSPIGMGQLRALVREVIEVTSASNHIAN